MDLAARGHISATDQDPHRIASPLDEILRQEEARLAAASVRPSYTEIRDGFTAQQWTKKRHLAIARTLEVLASRPTRPSESEASRGSEIQLDRILQRTNFAGSEVPLESVKLRLRARLDYLKIFPDGLVEVTDFKSGNVIDEEGEIENVTAIQLRLYGLMLLELISNSRLQLKVVSGTGTTEVSFSREDVENTRAWLSQRTSALRDGEQAEASSLAVVGPQCRGCTARLICPAYRNAVSELWKRTDLAMELPLDTAGTILQVEAGTEQTTLKIQDLAGRVAKIHRLSAPPFHPTQFGRDSLFWFFNLASSEAHPLHGIWRHPRNFYDLPCNSLEHRAWTLQAYRSTFGTIA
jgi:hypothetical protein